MRLKLLFATVPLSWLCAQQRPQVEAYVPMLTPLEFAKPVVPEDAKGTSGTVQLLVMLDAAGNVSQAEALYGPKVLAQPAIEAAQRQHYRPVLRNGHPVIAYTDAMVNFMANGRYSGMGVDVAEQMAASHRLTEIAKGFPRSKAQVLADLEQDAGTDDQRRRFYSLAKLASAAVLANENAKAVAYAEELLADAPRYRQDWNYGNAIHDGNLVLGWLAVQQGNLSKAQHYLLDAGSTPGSPQLNSFGPDMSLAKALLEKGDRDDVLEYFARCRKFWKLGVQQLDTWTETVRAGGMPDFSVNLRLSREAKL